MVYHIFHRIIPDVFLKQGTLTVSTRWWATSWSHYGNGGKPFIIIHGRDISWNGQWVFFIGRKGEFIKISGYPHPVGYNLSISIPKNQARNIWKTIYIKIAFDKLRYEVIPFSNTDVIDKWVLFKTLFPNTLKMRPTENRYGTLAPFLTSLANWIAPS